MLDVVPHSSEPTYLALPSAGDCQTQIEEVRGTRQQLVWTPYSWSPRSDVGSEQEETQFDFRQESDMEGMNECGNHWTNADGEIPSAQVPRRMQFGSARLDPHTPSHRGLRVEPPVPPTVTQPPGASLVDATRSTAPIRYRHNPYDWKAV